MKTEKKCLTITFSVSEYNFKRLQNLLPEWGLKSINRLAKSLMIIELNHSEQDLIQQEATNNVAAGICNTQTENNTSLDAVVKAKIIPFSKYTEVTP